MFTIESHVLSNFNTRQKHAIRSVVDLWDTPFLYPFPLDAEAFRSRRRKSRRPSAGRLGCQAPNTNSSLCLC